jgi:hypothetical protein
MSKGKTPQPASYSCIICFAPARHLCKFAVRKMPQGLPVQPGTRPSPNHAMLIAADWCICHGGAWQAGRAAAPPSSVMNSRRLTPNMGFSPTGTAADHTSWGRQGAGGLARLEPAGGSVSRSLGKTVMPAKAGIQYSPGIASCTDPTTAPGVYWIPALARCACSAGMTENMRNAEEHRNGGQTRDFGASAFAPIVTQSIICGIWNHLLDMARDWMAVAMHERQTPEPRPSSVK